MYREHSSYYHDYLAHHGVKGMKWGVRRDRNRMSYSQRRAAKKELKAQYKNAKSQAEQTYNSTVDKIKSDYNAKVAKADSAYSKETAPAAMRREAALAENQRRYDTLKKETDSYYKNEIDRNMRKAEKHDSDADWWGRDSSFGKESTAKANEYLDKAAKAEQRHNKASADNIADHESRAIEIHTKYDHETRAATERYTSALDKASAEQSARWAEAGAEYSRSVKNAKVSYKQAKKDLKRK